LREADALSRTSASGDSAVARGEREDALGQPGYTGIVEALPRPRGNGAVADAE
jgi:hypothetical protein